MYMSICICTFIPRANKHSCKVSKMTHQGLLVWLKVVGWVGDRRRQLGGRWCGSRRRKASDATVAPVVGEATRSRSRKSTNSTSTLYVRKNIFGHDATIGPLLPRPAPIFLTCFLYEKPEDATMLHIYMQLAKCIKKHERTFDNIQHILQVYT